MYQLTDKVIARFHAKVHRNGSHWNQRAPNETIERKFRGCWFWLGAMTDDGRYGKFAVRDENNKRIWLLAHRLSWHVYRGIIVPDRIRLTNECGTSNCIYPEHWRSSSTVLALALRYPPLYSEPEQYPQQSVSDEVDELLDDMHE